ncbi:hypothetical protein CK203_094090 [Vitis vinifera]|uniref:Uncharacterized protein n=1 Tax=Vitis vinifera TaxID=29760 RepID=A0A438CXM1_VITVI|nr:hypothetical protein CK203_094090 [Vitis vinifera]
MATPSRSRSSGREGKMILNGVKPSKEDSWRGERQLKALLQETERLREENAVLRIQASTSGPPRRQRSRAK